MPKQPHGKMNSQSYETQSDAIDTLNALALILQVAAQRMEFVAHTACSPRLYYPALNCFYASFAGAHFSPRLQGRKLPRN